MGAIRPSVAIMPAIAGKGELYTVTGGYGWPIYGDQWFELQVFCE
jgi:hypothetical protein